MGRHDVNLLQAPTNQHHNILPFFAFEPYTLLTTLMQVITVV
jgi:hypothetical protein